MSETDTIAVGKEDGHVRLKIKSADGSASVKVLLTPSEAEFVAENIYQKLREIEDADEPKHDHDDSVDWPPK